VLADQDSDSFFLQLLKGLEIGSPETIRDPLLLANVNASTLAVHSAEGISERDAITYEIERHRDEIRALGLALQKYRENRNKADDALVRAREMQLAGNLEGALRALMEVPEEARNRERWKAVGEIALELGRKSQTNKLFKSQ